MDVGEHCFGGGVALPETVQRAKNIDPRSLLIRWANESDEWVRYIVRVVLTERGPVGADDGATAYAVFRQEKALDSRELKTVEKIATSEVEVDTIESLTIQSLSDVTGVNALVEGNSIEPHEGLTVLFGENGTGKTGYARIFKALAASRTAGTILGNIDDDAPSQPSARITFNLGSNQKEYVWTGNQGVAPFTRISIFDNPSVSFHVDDDLEYVYVPASLALFNYVISGIKLVQSHIEEATKSLRNTGPSISTRFPRASKVYPFIESLGAATDLPHLQALADTRSDVDDRIAELRQTVAKLEANLLDSEIAATKRLERALFQATQAAKAVAEFPNQRYSTELRKLSELQASYRAFRSTLFEAAELPAEPDENWSSFIEAGGIYQEHLTSVGVHDQTRCPYCRQVLNQGAQELVRKYSELLEDSINSDLRAAQELLQSFASPINNLEMVDVVALTQEYEQSRTRPEYFSEITRTVTAVSTVQGHMKSGTEVGDDFASIAAVDASTLAEGLGTTRSRLKDLQAQANTSAETLVSKKQELAELVAAAELGRSWKIIELRVKDAKLLDRLEALSRPIPGMLRAVTELAKVASDQMINESFETYFREECESLRAPRLRLEFVGRQGRAQRRRVLNGKHKPSQVLSEGEQKVLAIADFLAEARLSGISAPVIFDDPVSSLDHRRISEVARRISALAEASQVIVFTHDILFATTLLQLMESSGRCSYFQISDDEGKGRVHRATGPRWDTLKSLRGRINESIQSAKAEDPDARAASIRTGYSWIRAWCEVFTEVEILEGVTQRYQPNVRMTNLSKLKVDVLPEVCEVVTRIYEDACRFIDGHSQPLPTLGVSPTLKTLEEHWAELQAARATYLSG